ncbi:MAG: prolyl oligopeptidase family serine peptidase [Saprospiraceae bacterium]
MNKAIIMKNKLFLLLGLALMSFACQNTEMNNDTITFEPITVDYPATKKVSHVDSYHDQELEDPFRWLEDDRADDTKDWVSSQNEVTFGFLEKIPFREAIKDRLEELWNYEKYSAPTKHGKYTYFYKNDGLQNQYVLYRQLGEGEPEVFLDPNGFSKDGTTSLAGMSFTKDGSMVAYAISEGGSDWRKIIVLDTETKKMIGDTIRDVKFSGISWKGNDGFYYSSYDKPKEGSELSGLTQYHKLFYHKLGTPQSDDPLIFGGEATPRRYIFGGVSEDENWLAISASVSTTGNELYIKDLRKSGSPIVPVVSNFDNNHGFVHSEGNTLYMITNYQAPNQRLVKVDAANPGTENWEDVIAERPEPLSVGTAGGYFFASYLKDALSYIEQVDLAGEVTRVVKLPGQGSVGGFGGKWSDQSLYYTFTSYINPGTIYKYDINSGQSELYKTSGVQFDPAQFESKQVFYTSKDGTKVPMMITHKKGLELNGENPTMLYGYGGFNISLTPSFSTSNIVWMENGGVYAVPNLRGGGEYGEKWHKAGTKMQKQNVFDDFIAAAEYLIKEGYTSSDYLAISGGSNGGLLVGATMTQRPDLMKVALPAVGVLDMLRYDKFTAGAGWAYDYGTAEESPEMFEYLKGYSPYHNLKEGTAYPATMVTTADHDDRVVPAHSFKFAARLQEAHAGENPVLIRIETNAGHGAGKPTSKIIEEQADKWAFTFYNMNVPVKYFKN